MYLTIHDLYIYIHIDLEIYIYIQHMICMCIYLFKFVYVHKLFTNYYNCFSRFFHRGCLDALNLAQEGAESMFWKVPRNLQQDPLNGPLNLSI